MEKNLNLKLNNSLTNVKNKFSSIFSRLFHRKKIQSEKNEEKNNIYTHKNSKKSAKDNKNKVEFVEKKQNSIKLKNNYEKGVIPPFVIKIIVSVVIIVVVSVSLFAAFYALVSNASLSFNVESIAATIREFFVMIFYAIAKWILCVVDIIFSYVRSLCGLNMDFTSLSGIFSAQSDIIFNLFITAEKRATAIFRNLMALAIILIIVFTIIALIKSQLAAMRAGKPKSVMETIKKTIRAFVLLLVTPFLAIAGIVFSDLLLQTLFRATNTTNSSTLGTQIFATASVSSNSYRNYAMANSRIPITCDFTREQEILEYYEHNSPSETFIEYLDSSNNLIYMTFMSFINDDFIKFTDINDILVSANSENREKGYFGIYDVKPNGNQYQRINAYAEEYYVMADVIDFGVNTGNSLYIKSIESVLDSVCEIADETLREKTFNHLVQDYEIGFYTGQNSLGTKVTASGKEFIDCQTYKQKTWNFIVYTSQYISPNENGTPENPMEIPYIHVKGAHDEIDGAKYLIAYQKSVSYGDITYTYFEPMTNGYNDRYDISFDSEYIEDGQIIAARGDFKDGVYPTAIKETSTEDTTQITFYREDLEAVAVGAMNEIFKANLNDDGDQSWFSNFVKMIQMFFQPDSIIGEISYNPEVIQASYDSKGIATVNNLSAGRIKLGYFLKFKPELPDRFAAGRTLSLKEIFDPQKFNLILILVAPIILCRVGMISIFGLIQRAYELFLIILTYPAACATIPYEEKAYKAWWDEYFQRLFATYGIILGINFVLALFPIISSLEYFTAAEIATNKILYKVTHLFFGFLTLNQITKLLNTLVVILFELVAFTLLDPQSGIPNLIDRMVGGKGLRGGFVDTINKLVSRVKKTVRTVAKVAKLAVKVVASSTSTVLDSILKPEKARQNLEKHKNFMAKLLPGSKFLDNHQKNAGKATKKAMQQFGTAAANAQNKSNDGDEEPKKDDYMRGIKDPGPNAPEEEKQKYEKDKSDAEKKFDEDHEKWKTEQDKKKKDVLDSYNNIINRQKDEIAALKNQKPDKKKDDKKSEKSSSEDKSGGKNSHKSMKNEDSSLENSSSEDTSDDSSTNSENETPKENESSSGGSNQGSQNSSSGGQSSGSSSGNSSNSGGEGEQENSSSGGQGGSNAGGQSKASKPAKKSFNPDDYGNRGLEDEMKDTQKRHRDEGRRQDALERRLAEQKRMGDTKGAEATKKLIEQSKQRQKELDDHYFEIYAAQQDRIAEEQRIMQSGTDEEKRQLEAKNRMRAANDQQRFEDKEARGETTSARIKQFAVGVATNVGNSVKEKIVSTAQGVWQEHITRRNNRWKNAFSNTNGNIFQRVGRAAQRRYVEQRMGGFARKNEYEQINNRLQELNNKYTHPENFDKNSQEYKDYIEEKTKLEKRRDVLENDFNELSRLKTTRTENKAKQSQAIMQKIIGNPDDYSEYEDTSTLYRKLRAVRHPLKTIRAKAAHSFMKSDKEIVERDTEGLTRQVEALKTELAQINRANSANQMRRKQEILTQLNHLTPKLEAYKHANDFFKKFDEQVFSRKIDHIKEDAIVYGEDKNDDEEE